MRSNAHDVRGPDGGRHHLPRPRRLARLGVATMQLLHMPGLVVRSVLRPQSAGRHGGPAVRRRTAIVVTMSGLVLVSGLAAGGLRYVVGSAEILPVSMADPTGRQAAADRADRAGRVPPSSAALIAPTPSVSPTAPVPAASAAASAAAPKPAWVDPLPGAAITSCFGPRWGTAHQGIDFALYQGATIRAAAAGTVVAAGWNYGGYGMSVMIDNGNGVYTHYAHAEQILVRTGQKVAAGQAIALEGATGDVTGPHLHFEVHLGLWNQVNPAPFLRARGVPVAGC